MWLRRVATRLRAYGRRRSLSCPWSSRPWRSGTTPRARCQLVASAATTLSHSGTNGRRLKRLLGLEERDRVSVRVLEPRRSPDPRRGCHVVDGLQAGEVVVLEGNSA